VNHALPLIVTRFGITDLKNPGSQRKHEFVDRVCVMYGNGRDIIWPLVDDSVNTCHDY
jgi:hypothetical protein